MLGQCYWNVLDFPDIVRAILLSTLCGAEYHVRVQAGRGALVRGAESGRARAQVYVCAALLMDSGGAFGDDGNPWCLLYRAPGGCDWRKLVPVMASLAAAHGAHVARAMEAARAL